MTDAVLRFEVLKLVREGGLLLEGVGQPGLRLEGFFGTSGQLSEAVGELNRKQVSRNV